MTNSHNTRAAKLTFHIPHGGALHGLAGYFEAVLYGNVGLSIHPQRMDKISKDMLSWFPLFFPFKARFVTRFGGCMRVLILSHPQEPLYLPSKSELQVTIWRLTNQRQVWYEWHAEAFLALPDASPLVSVTSAPHTSGGGSLKVPSEKVTVEGSPFIDNIEMPETPRSDRMFTVGDAGVRLVKIGQTSLHNPGGRSSWIGL